MKKLIIFLFLITYCVIGFSQNYYYAFEYKHSNPDSLSPVYAIIMVTEDSIQIFNANNKLITDFRTTSMEVVSSDEILYVGNELIYKEQLKINVSLDKIKNIVVWKFIYNDGSNDIFNSIEIDEKQAFNQDELFKRSKLYDDDREFIKNAFKAYIEFDTVDLNSIKNIDIEMQNKNIDRDEIVRDVKLISLEALRLLEIDSLKQLMDLMEKERDKFYLHPANNVENELNLNSVSISLYMIFFEKDEFNRKSLILGNRLLAYIDALHTLNGRWHEKYPTILYASMTLYSELGDKENVTLFAERFCKYCEEIDQVRDNEEYYSTLTLLKGLYEDANNKEKANICQRKLDKLN